MRTDLHRKYAALRRKSGVGNESKYKYFVRFLYKKQELSKKYRQLRQHLRKSLLIEFFHDMIKTTKYRRKRGKIAYFVVEKNCLKK